VVSELIDVTLSVNGTEQILKIEPRTLVVELLRDTLGLTGTHVGCDTTQCGCCIVSLDGRMVKSCTVLVAQADGHRIHTIESLQLDESTLHPMQQAFVDNHALQCGYCTPGMIMSAVGIAERHGLPDEETVRLELDGNLCRCTGYANIVKAVVDGAQRMHELAEQA